MAGGRHIKNIILAITRQRIVRLARMFVRRRKICP